jgi:hypothetical protein
MRICCEHCGMPKRRGEPVQEYCFVGEQHFLHRGCRAGWEAAPTMQLPSRSKVFGIAPGQRCDHCGKGRDVYLIQLPGEEEAAGRHKKCAAQYWRKMREFSPDSCARHSSKHDYNCYIGSTEWKRFRCEVIKQRGNRCERCGHVGAYLELHHKHYHSLGNEQPEDVELLCPKCHKGADDVRASLKWKGKS